VKEKITQRVILLGPGLTWFVIFLLLPLLLIFVYSLFQRGTYGGVVYDFTLRNYERLISSLVLKIFLNSLWIALVTTVLALLLGYPAAYFIATAPVHWRTSLLMLVILPFWTSYLIRTYAWIVLLNRAGLVSRLLLSVGIIEQPIQLLYNDIAIIIGLLYGYLPFMVLPLYASIERLNPELREASADLGATPIKTFLTVTFPLTLTGVITGAIFVFVPSLGNFFVPELLGGGQRIMIGNLITNQFLKARDWPYGSAMAFALMGLIMLVLLFQARMARRSQGSSTDAG
jgi:spermidine/putrescine transport system permease protein